MPPGRTRSILRTAGSAAHVARPTRPWLRQRRLFHSTVARGNRKSCADHIPQAYPILGDGKRCGDVRQSSMRGVPRVSEERAPGVPSAHRSTKGDRSSHLSVRGRSTAARNGHQRALTRSRCPGGAQDRPIPNAGVADFDGHRWNAWTNAPLVANPRQARTTGPVARGIAPNEARQDSRGRISPPLPNQPPNGLARVLAGRVRKVRDVVCRRRRRLPGRFQAIGHVCEALAWSARFAWRVPASATRVRSPARLTPGQVKVALKRPSAPGRQG